LKIKWQLERDGASFGQVSQFPITKIYCVEPYQKQWDKHEESESHKDGIPGFPLLHSISFDSPYPTKASGNYYLNTETLVCLRGGNQHFVKPHLKICFCRGSSL
jgi:hypothetical protein